MRRRILLTLSVIVIIFSMMTSIFSVYGNEEQSVAGDLSIGDVFELGYYPQSQVKDKALLKELNAIETEMTDYGFLQLPISDNKKLDMSYADVNYNGERYRKVYLGNYRVYHKWESEIETDVQYLHGYSRGNYYWFKWEPIKWKVMTVGENDVTAYSKVCLDYRHYNSESTAYWENCDLRGWLNDEFYSCAFSNENKKAIVEKEIENKNNKFSAASGGEDTEDKVWLLSYYEMTKENGFVEGRHYDREKEEYAVGSDYSYVLGLGSTQTSYNVSFFLRDVGRDNTTVCNECSFFTTSIFNQPFASERGKNTVPVKAIQGVLPVIAVDKTAVIANEGLPEEATSPENEPTSEVLPTEEAATEEATSEYVTEADPTEQATEDNTAATEAATENPTFPENVTQAVSEDDVTQGEATEPEGETAATEEGISKEDETPATNVTKGGESYSSSPDDDSDNSGEISLCRHRETKKVIIKRADFENDGIVRYVCKGCGAVIKEEKTDKINTVKLNKNEFIFKGKALKPGLTVKDSRNKTVPSGAYSVKIINRSNNSAVASIKKVGQYKAVVSFTGDYSGEKVLYFSVKPARPKLKRLKRRNGKILVRRKKSKIKYKYHIAVADNKKFKNAKTYKLSAKKTSRLIKGLKRNKKYYVRIRAYKIVRVDGKKAYMYSKWSKVKKIKVK